MKLSINWLKQFVSVREKPDQLIRAFEAHGFPCEALTDDLLDIEVTYNRGDLQSIYGLAIEFASWTGQPVGLVPSASIQIVPTLSGFNLSTEHPATRRYLATIIALSRESTPKEVSRRLALFGIRSISPVVDITNYVMLEFGVPLHAFDLKKIQSGLHLRDSLPGETIATLDGINRPLPPASLVFESDGQLVDLVGIMGGLNSAVDDQTKQILLQAAAFDATTIYQTSSTIRLTTEASFRYSRTVDPARCDLALARAATLLGQDQVVAIDYASQLTPHIIPVRLHVLNQLAGMVFSEKLVTQLLDQLHFRIEAQRGSGQRKILLVEIPSHRLPDVDGEVDVIEELVRLHGYSKIKSKEFASLKPTPPTPAQIEGLTAPARPSLSYELKHIVATNLVSLGVSELLTSSLLSGEELVAAEFPLHQLIRVQNPLNPQMSFYRPSLVVGLARAIAANPWAADIKFFEFGRVATLDNESEHIAVAMTGDQRGQLKAFLGEHSVRLITTDHPLARLLKLRRTITISELPSDKLPARLLELTPTQRSINLPTSIRPVSLFPPAVRDLSLIITDKISDHLVIKTISEEPRLAYGELFDRFEGSQFGTGKSSRSYHLVFDALDRTLTDQEVDGLITKIVKRLIKKYRVIIRG